jgi:MFS family permease
VVAFCIVLAIITYIDRVSMSFAAPYIRKDLGISEPLMGWVFAAFAWAYALFEIPGGYLGDRIGPRKVLLRVVVWWSFFTAALGFAWSFTSLLVTQFLFGAGEAGCFPNVNKAFTAWLPAHEKVRAHGTLWLFARWGGAFGPLLLGWVISHVGWRHAFPIFGSLGVIWAVAFYFWFHDDPMQQPGLNDAERALLRDNSKLLPGRAPIPWRKARVSSQFWLLCAQYFCHSYGFYFYITWLPTYLRDARHVPLMASAALSGLPLFCGGLGSVVGGLLIKPITRLTGSLARTRRMMAFTGFAGACCLILISTLIASPVITMLVIGLAGFFSDLVMPNAWPATMDVGGRFAGTLSGAMNMSGNIGGSLCPIIIGYLLKHTNHNWTLTFYISAAVYLLGGVCWLFLDPVTPIERETAVAA